MTRGAVEHAWERTSEINILSVMLDMQRTIVFGEGQVANSRLPKADHGHMRRWHILPLVGLRPQPLLTSMPAAAPRGLTHHMQNHHEVGCATRRNAEHGRDIS